MVLVVFATISSVIAQENQGLDTSTALVSDTSIKIAPYWNFFAENRFVDSMKNDSIAEKFGAGLQWQVPSKRVFKFKDPFDPFLHETYYRIARGKTWFFVISIVIVLYLVYYKGVFPKQFELRIKGLFQPHAFTDLIREQQISSAAGSIHAFGIGLMTYTLGIMLYLINRDFNQLNSFLVFVLVLISWSGFSIILYVFQWMFSISLRLDDLISRNLQRQINVNLGLALVLLPLFLVAYYNGTQWREQWILRNMYYVLIAWISLRLLNQFLGMIRDGMLSFVSMLYFCTFEIIPYLLLIKFLQNTL